MLLNTGITSKLAGWLGNTLQWQVKCVFLPLKHLQLKSDGSSGTIREGRAKLPGIPLPWNGSRWSLCVR